MPILNYRFKILFADSVTELAEKILIHYKGVYCVVELTEWDEKAANEILNHNPNLSHYCQYNHKFVALVESEP